ncbi:MAG TPA: hypothetical protein VFU73_14670 [Actinocrinis sp.]|nr:hypothetical protein [Actinocrinis sp.]
MSVEIEFEPADEGAGPLWPDAAGALGAEQLAIQALPWRTSDPRTLFVGRLVLAGAVLATACVTGFLAGQKAPQNQHTVAVHVADANPLTIDPVPRIEARSGPLTTPWTGTFDRAVALSVVNTGPDPVTILGGAILAPQIASGGTLPAGEVLAPGAGQTLRTRAHFDCVDYPLHVNATSEAATETTARLDIRTVDGASHHVSLLVDPYNAGIQNAVCGRVQNPQVLGAPVVGPAPWPSAFTLTLPIANRAPFPLRVNLDQQTSTTWVVRAGLILVTGESVVPAGGEGRIEFDVQVTDCQLARTAVGNALGFETLVFTDARLALNNPLAREFDQVFTADSAADGIDQVCAGQ